MSETFTWANSQSGGWGVAGDWSPSGGPPDAETDDAVIAAAGTYAVTVSGGQSFLVNQVTLDDAGATLDVTSGGTLDLAGAAPTLAVSAGTLQLAGGTIAGGTIADAGALLLTSAGTLDGLTYEGTLRPTGIGVDLAISGGLTVLTSSGQGHGTIDMSQAYGSQLEVLGNATLNDATLNFGDGPANFDGANDNGLEDPYDSGATLTLGEGFTIEGSMSGNGADLLGLVDGSDTLINAGLIAIGGALDSYYGTFVNEGDIRFTAGNGDPDEIYGESFTNTGSFVASDGFAIISATTLTNLSDGTLTGGTWVAADYGVISLDSPAITTDAASITLESGGTLLTRRGSLDTTLTTIAAGGVLSLASEASFVGSNFFTDAGKLLVSGGSVFWVPSLTVAAGGLLRVGADSYVAAVAPLRVAGTVANAGTISGGVVVGSGGVFIVSAGGVASDTVLEAGAAQVVLAGGSAQGVVVGSGVRERLFGGDDSGTTIQGGGGEIVSGGGTATGAIVSSGAWLTVVAGGSAEGATVSAGGMVYVSSGGVASGTVVYGGHAQVYAGGSTHNDYVTDGGVENVWAGGTATDAGADNGGWVAVYSGGTAVGVDASYGGTVYVTSGGVASGSVLFDGHQVVSAGGTASGTVVSFGGREIVLSGGHDGATTVLDTGIEYVASGGIAASAVISAGGALFVSSGGAVLSGLTLAGGTATISGMVAAGQTVTFAGPAGDLALYNLSAFSAAIAGVGQGDAFDLGTLVWSPTETVSFTEAPSNTSGTLLVANGTSSASLTLLGQYSTGEFFVTNDGYDHPRVEFYQP